MSGEVGINSSSGSLLLEVAYRDYRRNFCIFNRCLSITTMKSVMKSFIEGRVSFLYTPPLWRFSVCVHKSKIYKRPSWHALLWQVISDCVNHSALCYIKWHTIMWLIQHEMTYHCTKYHLENLGSYWGAEADCGLSRFEAGKLKE